MTKISRNQLYVYLLHLIGWLCFLFYPFFLGVPFRNEIFLKFILHTILLAIFFYTNSSLLIPKILSKKKTTVYFTIILLIIGVISTLNITFHHLLELDYKNFSGNDANKIQHVNQDIKRIARAIFSSLFIFAFSLSYKLLVQWFQAERKTKEIEKENLLSELSFLRSQVSPHFLFNTLNNIYSLSLHQSEKTSNAILKLSQLLRYMLYESDVKQVYLQKEVGYVNNYIELQKMRFNENVKIIFNVEGDLSGKMIEPMLLIPFVENAFKHGVNYNKKSEITISVSVTEDELNLMVVNTNNAKKEAESASGIGLSNITRRLELLYPAKHVLKIIETDDQFTMNLKILFHKK